MLVWVSVVLSVMFVVVYTGVRVWFLPVLSIMSVVAFCKSFSSTMKIECFYFLQAG